MFFYIYFITFTLSQKSSLTSTCSTIYNEKRRTSAYFFSSLSMLYSLFYLSFIYYYYYLVYFKIFDVLFVYFFCFSINFDICCSSSVLCVHNEMFHTCLSIFLKSTFNTLVWFNMYFVIVIGGPRREFL